jgi:GNAT superfamily N-acetyltransferase
MTLGIVYKEHTLTVDEFLSIESRMDGMDETTREQAEKALSNQICSIAAFNGNEIVGIGRLIGDAAIWWILSEIWVLPKYQRKGIGRQIVNWLLQYIKENGVKGSYAAVILVCAKDKEGFYEKFGFVSRPRNNRGAGMDMWLTKEDA